MYGYNNGIYGTDEYGEPIEPGEQTDREWAFIHLECKFIARKELGVRLLYGYKYEDFDLFFGEDGMLIDVVCTSSPHHSADKVIYITARIKKRITG